jgi:hypothetical protein
MLKHKESCIDIPIVPQTKIAEEYGISEGTKQKISGMGEYKGTVPQLYRNLM